MGNTSTTVFEFDSEAVKAVSEIEKLAAANRQLKKDLKAAAVEANRGNKSMEASLGELAQKYTANEAAVSHWREQLKAAENQTSKSVQAQQRLGGAMQKGVGAAQTLSTALNSADGTTQSLEGTAHAAASVVKQLAMLAGPKGMLVATAVQALEVAYSFTKATESKRAYVQSTNDAIKSMRQEIAASKDLTDEKARQLQIEKDLGDEKRANDWADLREKQLKLRNERAEIEEYHNDPNWSWGKAWQQMTGPGDDRLKAIDRDMLALGQQENLMVQRDDLAKQAADKKAQEERDEKIAERVRDKLGPVRGSLGQAAAEELRKGRDPADVRKDLSRTVGRRFGPDEQPALQQELDEIVQSSRSTAFGDEVAPGKKSKSAEQRRLDLIGAQLQSLQAERLTEESTGRVSKREKRVYDERELQLRAEQARVQAELDKKNLSDLEEKSDKQLDLLERIAKALETPVGQTALPPRPRQVARNPG